MKRFSGGLQHWRKSQSHVEKNVTDTLTITPTDNKTQVGPSETIPEFITSHFKKQRLLNSPEG